MFVAIIALLVVSLFFSGSETALTATNKMKLQTKARNNDIKSEKLLNLISKPSEFITAILIGNNIANILLPTLVTTIAIQYDYNIGVASAILTVTIIVFAEVLPKSVAATFPDRTAYLVYPIIKFVVVILKPITILLNGLTGFITKLLSRGQEQDVSISKDELRAMVDIADSEGMFHLEESHRIKGVLDFYNLNVKDVLKTPRVEVVALASTASFEEIRNVAIQNPFTRYPIYVEDIDNIVGVFHSKYLLSWSTDQGKSLESYSDTDPLLVYEFQSIEWVFREMTRRKKHMAIVLDEYGGTEGILTHEDIIEAMIGLEIEDETDLENEVLVDMVTDTEIICDGKISLRRLNSIFHTEIPEEEDVLAGYLLKELNYFPEEGETIQISNLSIKILETDGRMIKQVQIIK
ncbi:hemolysin and related protein containing CBS domains [Gracilibacillus boraciitolerans JCM 21714]|uniref:Hemolysin and related protein containing CBS domains n=1 Tax=Gracilibacillus boraciitolerans JCM 21714 TaxID=1298598 RepID=W4VKF8_9BACI|nr:CNNM domain-containing protein [Gracilibacillus boraciitolerans]GAE93697.1 hemolysin and related protein containing CBS domains [Gracilibacillus boraciitolerans JCM 21714]